MIEGPGVPVLPGKLDMDLTFGPNFNLGIGVGSIA